jgi:hypothetical protein
MSAGQVQAKRMPQWTYWRPIVGTGCLHTNTFLPCLPDALAMPAVPYGSPHLKCTAKSSNPLCCSGTANEKTAGCTWGGIEWA